MPSHEIILNFKPRGIIHLNRSEISQFRNADSTPCLRRICSGNLIPRLPPDISIALNASGAKLYSTLSQQSKLSVNRLRITKGSDGSLIPNSDNVTIYDTGLRSQSTLYVKDLGLQAPPIDLFLNTSVRFVINEILTYHDLF